MIVYDLLKVPNQRFNTNIGDNNFEFDFHTFRGVIYANVRINGEIADVNAVCTPNASLFNSVVNDAADGVFKFVSGTEDYPSYENFDGATCIFAFFPNGE